MVSNSAEHSRVDHLTEPQELCLKQAWTYLLQLWGTPVDGEKVFKDAQGGTPVPVSPGKKKNKSLFSKLQASYSGGETAGSDEDQQLGYRPDLIRETLKDVEPEAIKDGFWNMLRMDYPDNQLLRFLRARKWNTNKAVTMFARSMHWRVKENHPDEILNGGERAAFDEDKKGIIKNLELQKTVIPGRDKDGRPIVLCRAHLHSPKDQTEAELKDYAVLVIEQARLFLKDSVDTATILFDLSGFSLSNMDYTPVKFLITCFEAHYPESLGHLIIHKAPWVFQPIWNIIKNWLDPVVASKVLFTKVNEDLLKYISADQLPKYLGGSNEVDLDHYHKPDAANDVKMEDHETAKQIMEKRQQLIAKFIEATVHWIEADSKEDSQRFLEEKLGISAQISHNYLELDPYVRSRSACDTNGILKM